VKKLLTVSLYYRKNKKILVKLFFLSLLIGMLEIIGIFAIIPYVNIMFGMGEWEGYSYIENAEFLQNKTYITLVFLGFYLVKPVVLVNLIYKLQKTVGLAHAGLLNDIFSKSFDVDVYSKEQSSNLIRIYTRDSLVFVHSFLVQASVLATELIIFIFLFSGIVYYQPEAIWLFPVLFTLVFIGYYLVKKRITVWSKDVQKYDASMIRGVQEVHSAHDEIIVYQAFSGFSLKMKDIFNHKTLTYAKIESLMQMPRLLLETIVIFLVVLAIYYASQVNPEFISPSVAIFLVVAGFRLLPMVNKATQSLGWFKNGMVALDALNEIYKYSNFTRNIEVSSDTLDEKEKVNAIAISIQNVVFNIFSNQEKPPVSFSANYGEITCITGESGTGKSTLLKQISGVSDATGSIIFSPLFNSKKFDRKSTSVELTPSLSYVPQSPSIINDTIRANIVFMRNVTYKKDQIKEVLNVVELERRVLKSNLGVDAILSESGNNLSGGEKYRICLARALISNPDIIIMDEPTASLDRKTSIKIIQNIKEFLPKSAIIISTHDEGVMKLSNKVIKL
jgi:ABC-type multidrug transport system fused ATPase/permease subunit